MSLIIRTARPDDAPVIARFVRELAAYEKEPSAVEADAEVFWRQMTETPPPFRCLIAERDGAAAGFALFFETYSTWRGRRGLHLEDLYVPAAHRRHGVARALLQRLARIVREDGYGRLEWSVLHWNEPALAFYRSIGGEPLSQWRPFRMRPASLDRLADEDIALRPHCDAEDV